MLGLRHRGARETAVASIFAGRLDFTSTAMARGLICSRPGATDVLRPTPARASTSSSPRDASD
jgi:hypothetical protein